MQRPDRDRPIQTPQPLGTEGLVILALSAECELCPTMELHTKVANSVWLDHAIKWSELKAEVSVRPKMTKLEIKVSLKVMYLDSTD